jgi:hypothetical protein
MADQDKTPPKIKRKGSKENAVILWHQDKVNKTYNGTTVQVIVALIIGANFATNMVQAQVDPYNEKYKNVFAIFELVYNILFTIELMVNLYAHWFCPFFESGWNVFDCIVVSIGVITTLELPLPKAFSLLRMMRAFRVFRLFKRVKSLNKIMTTIVSALPGVSNAFLILAIVMSIYAILAVEFFQESSNDCHSFPENETAVGRTPRGNCAGEENFGKFSRSFYSMFQVLTGESWAEAIARPVIFFYDGYRRVGSALFFVSFVIINSFVLANVVVAVLLDKMQDCPDEEDEEADGAEGEEKEDNKPPANDLAGQLASVHSKVSDLASVNTNIQSQIEAGRSEMALVRQQIDTILRLVEEANANG